jgi:hypothetical protein
MKTDRRFRQEIDSYSIFPYFAETPYCFEVNDSELFALLESGTSGTTNADSGSNPSTTVCRSSSAKPITICGSILE